MKFDERRQFTWDPEIFKKSDALTALGIHAEYTRKFSAQPTPVFCEVNRADSRVDKLWHFPLTARTEFSRQIEIPCINMFQRPSSWKMRRLGISYARRDQFLMSNLILASKEINYFPEQGDVVMWNGFRYIIHTIELPPDAYWQQTGVWMGLICDCIVPPMGDASPGKINTDLLPIENQFEQEAITHGPIIVKPGE